MKAISLFVVLVVAKLCVIADRGGAANGISLLAFFWHDALVALAFAAVEGLCRRHTRVVGIAYYILIGYTALNVPIARLTSSPLTLQMIRGTGSALSDSIVHHLTPANLMLMLLTIGVAVIAPRLLNRWRCFPGVALPVLLLAGLAGAVVSARMPVSGYERNAVTALASSLMPRVQARAVVFEWRTSSFEYPKDPELNYLKGAAEGRNVVLIALESTGAQYLKSYGAVLDPMPNLTALTREAIVFKNAYAVYPESIKGLFSVLCSSYPAFDTDAANYERVMTPSLAQVLREARYRTALFHSGRFMYLGMRSIVENRGFEVLEDAGHIGGNHNSSFGVDEASTIERTLKWTASLEAEERFFLFYLPIAGHHPYETPEEGPFHGADERSRYLNALHYGDAALAQLIRGLKEQGKYTNTLFVIYGDHGEAFGQHHGNFGHTFFLYEENVRVPLMILAPGLLSKEIRVENPASLVDIAPTICDLLGVRNPSWQGVSLLDPAARTALFFTDYSLPLIGLRDGPWKFICETSGRGAQLFDVTTDLSETRSRAGHEPARSAQYQQRLTDWAAAQKALLLLPAASATPLFVGGRLPGRDRGRVAASLEVPRN